jgi:uncharacterized protein (TIGR03435 family)
MHLACLSAVLSDKSIVTFAASGGITVMRALPAFLFFSVLARAQDAGPAFEVATVKLNLSGPDAPNGFSPTPGRLRVKNCTLQ